jgi:hypothetical protein
MATLMGRTARLAIGLAVALALLGVASPAFAQEYTIYLHGHTEPLKASFYAEEAPWIFFRDDESQYVFAVGCDRVQKVERGGAPIPPPLCPVDRLPTTMPMVYAAIMDGENKRLDDLIAKLREQTRAVVAGAIATNVAANESDPNERAQAELTRRRNLDAIAVLQSQIKETLFDMRLSETRVIALSDASKTYPKSARQRFFFFTR